MFWKKHASTILSCAGAAGVVVTSVLTAKGQTKAELLIVDAAWEKNRDPNLDEYRELTTFEKVKAAIPAYLPAIISGAATIACIFGSNVLNKHQQASIASAYALLSNSYSEYKKKVYDIYGADANNKVKEEIAKDHYEALTLEDSDEECLFFDFASLRYFSAPMSKVISKTTMDDGMECYIISTPFMDPMNPEW